MSAVGDAKMGARTEIESLRRDNEVLLRELENAYAQLTAVMQVSQDETRIAYSELQDKLVVLEKKLFEMSFLSDVGAALAAELDLTSLQQLVVEKTCLILPADLVSLHMVQRPSMCIQRQRDLVRAVAVEGAHARALLVEQRHLDLGGSGVHLIPDLDAVPESACLRLRPDARSAAAVSLRGRRALGLLVLNSRMRANFRDDQEPLLGTFGNLAGAALENAWRLERHQEVLANVLHAAGGGTDLLRRGLATPTAEERSRVHELQRTVRTLLLDDTGGSNEGQGS